MVPKAIKNRGTKETTVVKDINSLSRYADSHGLHADGLMLLSLEDYPFLQPMEA